MVLSVAVGYQYLSHMFSKILGHYSKPISALKLGLSIIQAEFSSVEVYLTSSSGTWNTAHLLFPLQIDKQVIYLLNFPCNNVLSIQLHIKATYCLYTVITIINALIN